MRGGWGRRNSVAPQAGSAALDIHGVDLHTKKWSYELGSELRETVHITSINPDVVHSAAKLREREKIAISSPFAQIILMSVTRLLEGFPRQFLRAQDRHAAPARSSHLSLREPPWKKRPPRPGQGETYARGHMWHRHVTRGPPPTTPLGGWSPHVPYTAREARKRAQVASGCSHQIA